MRWFKKVVYFGGAVVSSVAMLPLSWGMRVGWYRLVHCLVNTGLGYFSSIYSMLADDGVRYGMGKAEDSQMQSIKALELVLKELERRRVQPADVSKAYAALKADGVPPVEVPYALARSLLDEANQSQLFKHIKPD